MRIHQLYLEERDIVVKHVTLKDVVLSMNIVFPAVYILARWFFIFFIFFRFKSYNKNINENLLLAANKRKKGCTVRFT